jgi:hypothetical protein
VPRPRRFVESASPEQIAQEYAEGRSTRELEAKYGLSRWCVTAWCLQHGVGMRTKDEALSRQRYFASLEEDRREAVACCWPKCSLPADEGRLCMGHWLEVAELLAEGVRSCVWPPVCYERPVRDKALCDYHSRRVTGEISG